MMSYARSRLWLGVTGVGTWTLIAATGIWRDWSAPHASGSLILDLLALAAVYVAIQAPFDWLGGYYLPRKFGRVPTDLPSWARGVVVQVLCWVTASAVLLCAGQAYGIAGAAFSMSAIMLVLVLFQASFAQAVGSVRTVSKEAEAYLVSVADPAFVGGWVGLGPTRRLLMPGSWPVQWRTVQYTRRSGLIASGARAAGLALAFSFNLAGLLSALTLTPGAGFSNTGAYLRLIFGFTLWSFVGLLILPSFSRPAVFTADRFAASRGVPWQTTAWELDRLQDDEPARPKWIERTFHPVPSLTARLESRRSRTGAWQAARLALYLSWSVPGLLARSVHCNVGRPDLWVLFPGD